MSAMPRDDLSRNLQTIVDEVVEERFPEIAEEALMGRQIVTALIDKLLVDSKAARFAASGTEVTSSRRSVETARQRIHPILLDRIDPTVASQLDRAELAEQVTEIVSEILTEQKLQLNRLEQRDLVTLLLNEMMGLGPL